MRNFVLFSIFLSTVVIGACSNGSSPASSAANRPTAASPGRNLSTPDSPTTQKTAGNSRDTENTNTDISLAQPPENRRRRRPEADPNLPQAPLQFRAAPGNSEIATTMNASGRPVEIRVFRSDPNIARVESTWLDEKQRLLRITFKDGRIIETKTDKFNSLLEMSAVDIAALANGR